MPVLLYAFVGCLMGAALGLVGFGSPLSGVLAGALIGMAAGWLVRRHRDGNIGFLENALSARSAYSIAVIGGAGLWLITAAISDRREAWDDSLYWTAAYPLAVALAGALGALSPERAWRWGLTIMLAQAFVLAITAASFSLLPLGLILFSILSLPPVAAALVAAALRVQKTEQP